MHVNHRHAFSPTIEIKAPCPPGLPDASLQVFKGIQFLERRPAHLTLKTGYDVQTIQSRQTPKPPLFVYRQNVGGSNHVSILELLTRPFL